MNRWKLYLLGACEYTIFSKKLVYCSACYLMLCLGPGVPDIGGSIRLTLPTKAKHIYGGAQQVPCNIIDAKSL
jgi:hypothetical protein